jgi:hypothetical protein
MTDQQINDKEREYDGVVNQFLASQPEIISNALRKPDEKILAVRNSMKTQFDQFSMTQREKIVFMEDSKLIRQFGRSKDRIKKDAEYALATALHLEQSKKKEQIIKQHEQEEKEMDSDIEKLKKELKDLDDK